MADQAPGDKGERILEGLKQERVSEGLPIVDGCERPAAPALGGDGELQRDEGRENKDRHQHQRGGKDEEIAEVAVVLGATGEPSGILGTGDEPGERLPWLVGDERCAQGY